MQLKAKTIAITNAHQRIASELAMFEPIELSQAVKIKLMKRTEIKFLVNVAELSGLLSMLSDRFMVQTIGQNRSQWYTTTYLDTANLSMYAEHRNKHSFRQKVRLRTYALANETYFEVKTSNNGNTNKQRIQLQNGSLWSKSNAVSTFLLDTSSYRVGQLQPSIVSEFNRITLVDTQHAERLTIDTDIQMQNVRTMQTLSLPNVAVVELKCEKTPSVYTAKMVEQVHLEQSSFSKYCIGVALTDANAEKRGFEQQLFLLKKISQRVTNSVF